MGLTQVVTDYRRERATAGDEDRRDLRLDACRGLALWFIFIDHIPDNDLSWLTLRNYGFSDTTEVFVFVSGYTCMLAYGGALQRLGWAVTVTRALRRGVEIYAASLLLLLAYIAAVHLAGGGAFLDETNTGVFLKDPGAAILHAGLMQYTPVNTDVLPTFVLLHLVFPLVLWLMTRSASAAVGASLVLYLLVQWFSWNLPAWPRNDWYFNPLAWQMLFVFGAWCATDGIGQWRMRGLAQSRAALALAVLYLLFSLAVTMSWQFKALEGWMPEMLSKLIYPIDKSNLSPVRLLHFLALAVVVVQWMPREWHGLNTPWMKALIRCGEHSLPMYCFGVILSFAAQVMLVKSGGGLAMEIAASVAGIAIMIVAATLLTSAAKLDRHGPKLF